MSIGVPGARTIETVLIETAQVHSKLTNLWSRHESQDQDQCWPRRLPQITSHWRGRFHSLSLEICGRKRDTRRCPVFFSIVQAPLIVTQRKRMRAIGLFL